MTAVLIAPQIRQHKKNEIIKSPYVTALKPIASSMWGSRYSGGPPHRTLSSGS